MLYFDNNANYQMSRDTAKAIGSAIGLHNISATKGLDGKGEEMIAGLKSITKRLLSFGGDMIITGGASESNATIINHFVYIAGREGRKARFACAEVFHASSVDMLKRLQADGLADVRWLPVDMYGKFTVPDLSGVDCLLIQSVNSDTGDIVPIWEFCAKVRSDGCKLAIDDAQGFMKTRLEADKWGVDYITVSYQKVGGPIGIGALLYRESITPLIGGRQNGGIRGGTYNAPAIMGALSAVKKFDYRGMPELYERFMTQMAKYVQIVGPSDGLQVGTRYFILLKNELSLKGVICGALVDGKQYVCGGEVKYRLFQAGILIGTGSACGNESEKPEGMANAPLPEGVAVGMIRISFSQYNTIGEVDRLAKALYECT